VTFVLQRPEADTVHLVGDFTGWLPSKAMRRSGEGAWRVGVELQSGHEYGFRYLVDGAHWVNDPSADKYVSNPYGSDNSVVIT
jgi:1,4-alpha-glucan branching enzyme